MVLRVIVSEAGGAALPPLDVADAGPGGGAVIGSGAEAHVRLPGAAAAGAHVRLAAGRWAALADVVVDGRARVAGEDGAIGDGVTLALGGLTVRVAPAPAGAPASTPQRTASLARELVRGLLGGGAAPSFTITRGPGAGATRLLPPPEATLVIGRGDDATWVILDEDLSRRHAEIRRGWDGVTIADLGSRNGTRVAGARLTAPAALRDGDEIELGGTRLTFHDPAERHLRGAPPASAPAPAVVTRAAPAPAPPAAPAPAPPPAAPRSPLVLGAALAVAAVALAGLAWVLAS